MRGCVKNGTVVNETEVPSVVMVVVVVVVIVIVIVVVVVKEVLVLSW